MKNRLPKRLSAWLLTLIMLVGMLPAMASADEVDDDLGPPAPQEENYGYVRLVFSEGEQIDLYHGEYITERSPTAEVFGNAGEDFITDGEYAALYYEGKLYCKATLDGVSINADAVLPAEDFALVPMGEAPTTLSEEREDETPPAVEVVAPEDESSGSDKTVGTPPQPEPEPPALPESKEEDKTTKGEGDPSGSDYNVGADTQPQGPVRVHVMQAPMLAAAETEEYPPIGVYNNIGADEYHSGMSDNTYLPSMESVDKDNEFEFLPHQGNGAPENYVLWYENGVLHMNGYTGGRIETKTGLLQPKPLEILVEDDSTIQGSQFGCISLNSGKGKYHSLIISSPNSSKLTLNLDATHGEIAAIDSAGGSVTENDVTLQGSVVVEANVNSTATSGRAYVCGIEARDVAILGNASFKAVCTSSIEQDNCAACGIVANGNLTVDTTGTIDIDVSDVSQDGSAYSIGLHGSRVYLRRVTYMAVKWAHGYPYANGLAIYPNHTVIENHAVCHPNQTDYTSAIYRYGVPRKVTLTDCDITSAKDLLGRPLYTEGTFLFNDELTIKARNHGYPVMGWQTNSITPSATTDPLKYQVHDDTENLTIKPLYRLGEEGGLSFEWTGSDTGQVRLKLFSVSNIPMKDIRLDVIGYAAVVGEATYDYGNKMLLVPVSNLNTKSYYRLTVKNTSGTELYSGWFQPIPVDTPTIDKPSGRYYGSMNVNVTPQPDTKVFYKTGSAEIYSGSEGTAFSGDPIVVEGTDTSLTLRARRIKNGVAIWSTPVTATWTKLDTLPVPNVRFYDGENEVMPGEGNTVYFHEKLTAVLSKPSPWPVNAEMRYSTADGPGGGTYAYTEPVEYTAAGTLWVNTRATLANGTEPSKTVRYTIQQDASHVKKMVSTGSTIKLFNPPDSWTQLKAESITGSAWKYNIYVGAQIKVLAPLKQNGLPFYKWKADPDVVVFSDPHSYLTTFTMPDRDFTLTAEYRALPTTGISQNTNIDLDAGKPAGKSLSLRSGPNDMFSEWRHLKYQWYEGDSTTGTSLDSFAPFEIGKTYTARVTITVTEGCTFTNTAAVQTKTSPSNGFISVAEGKLTRAKDKKSIAFDLHLITKPELTIAPAPDAPLPTAADLSAQLPGFTVTPTWGAATAPSGATQMTLTKLEIKPVDGSYQLANRSVWINGMERTGEYGHGSSTLTLTNITVPVKSKGVSVRGTVKSYGSASEAVTVTLLHGTSVIGSPKVLTGASGSAPYSQTYSFDTVPAGEYTLKVEKKGHAPWTESITVDSAAIAKDVTVYLWGDVNRDGDVTAADAQEIQRNAAKLSSAYDTEPNKSYWILRADVNRDGDVTAADAQEIQRNAAKLSSAIDSLL